MKKCLLLLLLLCGCCHGCSTLGVRERGGYSLALGTCDKDSGVVTLYTDAIKSEAEYYGVSYEDLKELVLYHELYHRYQVGSDYVEDKADKYSWRHFVKKHKRAPRVDYWPH
jgi:hypothetical protein